MSSAESAPDVKADGLKLSMPPSPINAPLRNATLQPATESESLLLPQPFSSDAYEDEWEMPHRSTLYLISLTLLMAGLQIAWSVELAYISPYLLSLGVVKSTLSLIWIAGPASGVIVQPLIGMLSDRSTFKWGRRRVFIVVSTACVVLGFIGMGRTKEVVSWWTRNSEWERIRGEVVGLAVASLIILDLAINATTAAARALIVDCVPTDQQGIANAWAGRMIGIGNVVGYLSGYINLPYYLPFLGETQFQILCILAPVLLVITAIITCVTIKEVDPALLFTLPGEHSEKGFQAAVNMLTSISRLPPRIRHICNIQFFAWIGWFLFLIWNTTYTGEIYVKQYLKSHPPPSTPADLTQLWDTATRLASFALLLESVVALLANLFLPLFLHNGLFHIHGVTLRRLWLASHVWFAMLMWSTLWIRSVELSVTMVGMMGFSWALTLWAPFALIARTTSAINDQSRRESLASSRSQTPDLRPVDYGTTTAGTPEARGSLDLSPPLGIGSGISVSNPDERRPSTSTPLLHPQPTRLIVLHPEPSSYNHPTKSNERREITSAGTIMGLHNVFISSPQFLSTLLASIIFHFLNAGGRDEAGEGLTGGGWFGGSNIAVVLSVGGCGGVVAAWLTWRLGEDEYEGEGIVEGEGVMGGMH